jgi:hypothetical protein
MMVKKSLSKNSHHLIRIKIKFINIQIKHKYSILKENQYLLLITILNQLKVSIAKIMILMIHNMDLIDNFFKRSMKEIILMKIIFIPSK